MIVIVIAFASDSKFVPRQPPFDFG